MHPRASKAVGYFKDSSFAPNGRVVTALQH